MVQLHDFMLRVNEYAIISCDTMKWHYFSRQTINVLTILNFNFQMDQLTLIPNGFQFRDAVRCLSISLNPVRFEHLILLELQQLQCGGMLVIGGMIKVVLICLCGKTFGHFDKFCIFNFELKF